MTSVMRREPALLLAVSAIVLAGCGSSGDSQHAPKSAGAAHAAHPRSPANGTLTRSQALTFARAVNLTHVDLPGFSVAAHKHEPETATEQRLERQLIRCAGAPRPRSPLAEVRSPSFEVKRDVLDLSVSSEVAVARTPALASGELAAIHGSRVRGCFARYLDTLLRSRRYRGATLSPVTIAAGVPPARGASGSFGWRITAAFAVRGIRLSLYVDILGFVVGPARVTLVSSGVVMPFPAAIQERLFSLLLARARSADDARPEGS